ncbi:MAG: DNA topoisomerase [Clostridiales bacterium]|nr:DNA topoisomerase [Clostridiales bacterium]
MTALKGADRVRLRPGVIFGSDGLEGCEHSIFEILSNSIDEAREGYGDTIEVIRYADRSIEVRDYGRGIPLDYNQREGRYNWELVYCELYAGGKYNNNDASKNYEFSLGLNGLGCCATQYSSEYFDVAVMKDGYRYDLHFEKGNVAGELKKRKQAYDHTGTIQRWRPDLEVFTDIGVSLEYYQNTLKKQAVVNAGLTFKLHDEESGEDFTYCYPDGIVGYLNEVCGEGALTPVQFCEASARGRDREDKPEYKLKMQAAFCFHNERGLIEYYHNSSWLEHGGSPDKAVRAAFVYELDRCLRQRGKYTKDEPKITFADVQDSLAIVTNSLSTETSYENQTKKAITNRFIQEAMTDFLKHQLEVYLIENKADSERILDQVLLNKRSRETAEKARINLRKKLGAGIDIGNRVKKFVDCRTKDIDRREIYIVEGDSALGSCKLGRDAEFQAIMPLRGKILNCLKANLDSIFRNEVITDLLRVLGCGVEVKAKHVKDLYGFDMANLRWDKIIICTDADVDGFQIRTLVLTMLYRLAPTLINEGKVYIAESPLYEITAKNRTFFAYDEREKAKILSGLGGAKYTLQRSKGLGENEPDMMWETTMNPETRRLIKIVPSDVERTERYFDFLLGDNLAGRKEFIEKNGHRYLDQLDVV